MPVGIMSGHIRICNQHFSQESFVPYTSVLRLRYDAVPTIVIPSKSENAACQIDSQVYPKSYIKVDVHTFNNIENV